VAKWLGRSTAQRPLNQLKDISYVKPWLAELEAKLGHFPDTTEIGSVDSSMLSGIYKYHGGIRRIRSLIQGQ